MFFVPKKNFAVPAVCSLPPRNFTLATGLLYYPLLHSLSFQISGRYVNICEIAFFFHLGQTNTFVF